jgi:hypothetical protein
VAKTVIYRVEGPDGKILRIEGPEGATDDELTAAASEHYQAQQPKPAQRVSEPSTLQRLGIHAQALKDTFSDRGRYAADALRSFGMGAADLALGAGQLMSKTMGDEQSKRYGDAMRWVEQGYQEGRDSNTPDVGRFTGNVVAAGLATGGTAPAATLGGRMIQGAKMGGAMGLVSPVDPDAQSYALSKAVQVGGGTVLGGEWVTRYRELAAEQT